MHIPVSDVLAQEVGYRKIFEVAGEQPELEDVALAEPVNGMVTLTRLDDGVGATAQLTTSQMLECHRCLQAFPFRQTVKLSGEFSRQPHDDQLLLDKDMTIDLSPLVREELILGIPLKQLCKPDCLGIDPETGEAFEKIEPQKVDAETSSA
jgi:uncharacterized protein